MAPFIKKRKLVVTEKPVSVLGGQITQGHTEILSQMGMSYIHTGCGEGSVDMLPVKANTYVVCFNTTYCM